MKNIDINAHSSIKINGTKTLYFDAFKVAIESHDADIIFITHEHFDHYDIDSIKKIKNDNSIIVAPKTMESKIKKDGIIDEKNCMFLEPLMDVEIAGVKISAVPAYNIGKPFHPKANKWLGYVVIMDEKTYYVAGDTDSIEENFGISCDVALVPVGGMYTMDKKQAAEYVSNINPKIAIPTHYGDVAGSPEDGQTFKQLVGELNKDIQVELKL